MKFQLTERIEKMRNKSRDAEVWIDPERAQIYTEFYRENLDKDSIPVGRAKAFYAYMTQKELYLGDGEMIVGERGRAPKLIPTYPEIACHSLQDLEELDTNESLPYHVTDECRKIYEEEVIPFWKERALRDKVFNQLSDEWMNIYNAGLITETLEQRTPGSTALDERVLYTGLLKSKEEIAEAINKLDFMNDPDAIEKREELKAMDITCDAVLAYAERYAKLLSEKATEEKDEKRKKELEKMAAVCRKVPAHAPEDLWEVLQMSWFLHVGVICESNGWDACNAGRIDQHFYPFYKKAVADGYSEDEIKELICAWWVKYNNHPAPAKYGTSAKESGTYNDFVNLSLGGMTKDGEDAVNELTYILLDVLDTMSLVQPQVHILVSRVNTDKYIKEAARVIRVGRGFPAVFNEDAIIEEQLRCGKEIRDARGAGICGCVETTCYGKEAAPLIGYVNFPKIMELALHDGFDPRTGVQIGPKTGKAETLKDFNALMDAYKEQAKYVFETKLQGTQYLKRMFGKYAPQPFLSTLIEGCVDSGKDYNNGGPVYNVSLFPGVGIGTITDSMAAVKKHVYEEKDITMQELMTALDADFEGYEDLRKKLVNETPHYGNNDDYADEIMKEITDYFFDYVDGKPDSTGGTYRANMLPTTCHVYFGQVTGATPDGRHAGRPQSEGISPVQGSDTHGPTAVIQSVSKMDQVRTCGTLLNMKFLPDVLKGDTGLVKLTNVIRTYFRMGGHHVQFNVCDAATLRRAQKHPEEYRDLIVRVAGYSDYFNACSKELQDEIIARHAHEEATA